MHSWTEAPEATPASGRAAAAAGPAGCSGVETGSLAMAAVVSACRGVAAAMFASAMSATTETAATIRETRLTESPLARRPLPDPADFSPKLERLLTRLSILRCRSVPGRGHNGPIGRHGLDQPRPGTVEAGPHDREAVDPAHRRLVERHSGENRDTWSLIKSRPVSFW